MRLSIDRHELSRVLSSVTKVVETRNTIPILSNVLLSVANGRLTVRATDLEIEATASVATLDATDGETTVSGKLLADIVKKATADVLLEVEGATLTVKSGRSRYKLPTLPAEDFPSFAAGTFTTSLTVDLAQLLAPVSFAVSTEATRYYLNGVFLHVVDGQLVAAATDGHRLSRHVGQAAEEFEGVILPRKLVGLVLKGSVHVSLSPTKIRIEAADSTLTSKLIDGTFPDYQRVIPKGNDKIVVVDKAVLQKAADRVSTVSSERGRAVRLEISDGTIKLDVNNPDSGSATEEVAVEYQGEPVTIGFNSRYLSELLSVLGGERVRMAISDGGGQALLTSVGDDDLLTVLMPMRV